MKDHSTLTLLEFLIAYFCAAICVFVWHGYRNQRVEKDSCEYAARGVKEYYRCIELWMK